MKIPVSRRLQKMQKIVTENDYLNNLEERQAYLNSLAMAARSGFGTVLLEGLETLERLATEKLIKTNNAKTVAQCKAEIKTARFIKNMISAIFQEKNSIDTAIESLQREDENYVNH